MEVNGHQVMWRFHIGMVIILNHVHINVKQIIHGMKQHISVNYEHIIVDELSQHEMDINSEREYIRMDIHQHHGHIQVVHYDHVCINVIQVIYGIQQIKNVKL
jgi:hypothetical protein